MRRSRGQLQRAVDCASTRRKRAQALFRLAVFHDNNSREAEAIPIYRRALRVGLDPRRQTQALAWLASSLFKTRQPAAAMRSLQQTMKAKPSLRLREFLTQLKHRIASRS